MRLFLLALVLGCAALAVQSKFIVSNSLNFAHVPDAASRLTLFRLPLAVVTLIAPPPPKPKKLNLQEALGLIEASAGKHRVPATFVRSIMAAESNYNSEAVSPAGAIGLMQLMPETAEEMGADPSIPQENVDAGTRYLRLLIDRYGKGRDPLRRVIAAYNAGPGNVDHYKGVPPFRETRSYVKRVIANIRAFEEIPKKAPVTLASIMAD